MEHQTPDQERQRSHPPYGHGHDGGHGGAFCRKRFHRRGDGGTFAGHEHGGGRRLGLRTARRRLRPAGNGQPCEYEHMERDPGPRPRQQKKRSTFEYGAFFEYGSGNYTTHDGDNRGDGSVRNTGGGVLAKWTAAHGFYVEGSLRAGTVHDDARSVLRDAGGNAYGYDTNAGYWGAHLGAGKEIPLANGNTLDVYGKFFYNRRNGVSFTANKSNFDLDAVTSEVLRVGARYTMKREKWNFYGGLAYEHELDGKATGTVNNLTIRSADIGGGSFRGELGATMQPGENRPWSLDLNVTGFAGKKQGVTGGVSVSFTF